MSKLRELEQRLRDEPDNLGLRVVVAGALHEAGRRADAVELYRSVAIAYRDQGRQQQAITVCRSILELAPEDAPCQELLAALLATAPAPRASPPPGSRPSPVPASRPSPLPAGPSPSPLPDRPSPSPLPRPSETELAGAVDVSRRSSGEMTPLPPPLAYHEADPTTGSQQRLSPSELPPSLREELAAYPEIAGIAAAARQISASLIAASRRVEDTQELDDSDLAAELDTGRLLRTGGPRLAPSASVPPPAPLPPSAPPSPPTPSPVARPPTPPSPPAPPRPAAGPAATDTTAADDDDPTLPPPGSSTPSRTIEDEATEPRELPTRVRPPSIAPPTVATGPLAGAFFAPLPPRNRAAVLQRFRRRIVAAGTAVIRRGETGHGLVVVVRGRLELHAEGEGGAPIALGAIEPGEFIGEASLLARAPAAAEVTAGTDAELLVLSADDFHDVTRAFPGLRAEIEATAARRAREHEQRLRA